MQVKPSLFRISHIAATVRPYSEHENVVRLALWGIVKLLQ
jgi:hypothetical protein